MELNNLGKKELVKLIKDAENKIVALDNKQFDDAYLQIAAIAKKVGLTIQELEEHGINRKLNKVKAKAAIKYQNKDNLEETWTGRGKQPGWVKRELEAGKNLEDFLIA
ncbi:H-NS histone family protein [Acinetobacter gandensis]|uniref:H-NS histone family protein n=1 Tax=Acinetobacter gandensis TaxID=1443941 RepID=UPI003989E166